MDIHFSCTMCGKCCQNLKLPLTIAEATRWLSDGNGLQIICEAMPWGTEPRADDLQAAHRRRRSFATMSGSLPARVIVILAANFAGACPYLQSDMKCGIYPSRPLVCRIYPAEINPFVELVPANKGCPPEAWTSDRPLLQRKHRLVDAGVQALIEESRDTDARETEAKRRLCETLGLNSSAVAGEGLVVYSPDRARMLAELTRPMDERDAPRLPSGWRFISNQANTVEGLHALGADSSLASAADRGTFEYLGFKR